MKKHTKIFIAIGCVIVFIFVINFFFPKQIVIECQSNLDKEFNTADSENMIIDLYYNKVFLFFRKNDDKINRTLKVSFKNKLTGEEAFYYQKSLKSIYCNKNIKETYSCDSSWDNDTKITLKEEGTFTDVVEKRKRMTQKQYLKSLKKDGYTCKRKK